MILRDNVQNKSVCVTAIRHLSVPKYSIIPYGGTNYSMSTSGTIS